MYRISYVSPHGEHWDLSERLWTVAVSKSGIKGLVGELDDSTVSSAQWGGQTVTHQAPKPMTGELTLVVYAESTGDVDDMYARLRAGFSSREEGTLNISGDRYGSLTTSVRLNGHIESPDVDTEGEQYVAEVTVPLIADSGLWLQEVFTERGVAEVNNPAAVPMHVGVTWQDKSQLVLPSGWVIGLPAAGERVSMSLDPRTGYTVRDAHGDPLPELTREVVKSTVPEPVPPGSSRTYTARGDAAVTWQVPTLDPWI